MRYSVYVMVGLKAFQDFLCTFINAAPNRRLLNYSILKQWQDVMPPAALSAVMCLMVMASGAWLGMLPAAARLGVQVMIGMAVYLFLAWALKMKSFGYLWNLVKEQKRHS